MTSTTIDQTIAERAAAEFFDGRVFAGHAPNTSHDQYKEQVPEIIRRVVGELQAGGFSGYADEEIGRRFYEPIDRKALELFGSGSVSTSTLSMRREVGAWLRGLLTSPKFPLPDWASEIPTFDFTGPAIMAWVANDHYDIAATVSEQLADLAASASTRTSGSVKEYMSKAMRHKTERLLQPGTRFTVKDAGTGDSSLRGIGGTRADGCEYVVKHLEGPDSLNQATHVWVEDDGDTHMSYVLAHHVETVHSVNTDTPVVEEPADEVAALKAQLEREREAHQQDIARISEVFWKEAKEREWCTEAEAVIRYLNHDLSVAMVDRRPVTQWQAKLTSERWGTYVLINGIEADSEDQAETQVRDTLGTMNVDVAMRDEFLNCWNGNGFGGSISVDEETLDSNLFADVEIEITEDES